MGRLTSDFVPLALSQCEATQWIYPLQALHKTDKGDSRISCTLQQVGGRKVELWAAGVQESRWTAKDSVRAGKKLERLRVGHQ